MPDILRRSFGDASTNGRTVFGLAVPYGQTATVSDGGPAYTERFLAGAFARSIAERGHKVRLFAQHDTTRFPLGRAIELRESADGLHAAFAVAQTRDGDDALALVRDGLVEAFSVGFRPIRSQRAADGTVERQEASLSEVSLVAEPAYTSALVGGVRQAPPLLSVDIAARRLDLILTHWS